jgi:trigger factor
VRTTLKERDGNTVKLVVEVSPEELKVAYDSKLRELMREVRIPGFRPGKAPMAMVKQKLGDEAILADAVEASMGQWFAQAMIDLGLVSVDRPDVDLGEELPELDKPLEFSASVTVMPEVALGKYKGLVIPKVPAEVTDEEVDARVDRLRDEFAELRPVSDRAVQKGDYVTADFQASLEGTPVNDLEASDYLFEVGGNTLFPEVEAQVVGMSTGDKRSFSVTLAEDIPAAHLSGKTVEFSLALKEIKEKALPEVSDQWVSEVSEFATVLEFRADIRGRLQSAKTYSADQKFRNSSVAKAVDNVTIDLPDVAVQREAAELLAEFKSSIEARGGTLEQYLAVVGVPFERMVEDLVPQAANNVKTRLVLDAIIKAEGIEVSDEEVATVVGQMALANKIDLKTLETRLRKNDRLAELKQQILRDKAAEIIVESAVEGPPEGAGGAGKPAAGKKRSEATAAAKKPAAAKVAAEPGAAEPAEGSDAESGAATSDAATGEGS